MYIRKHPSRVGMDWVEALLGMGISLGNGLELA